MRCQPNRHSSNGSRALAWLQWLLLGTGIVLLAVCAAVIGDGMIAQQAARSALAAAARVEKPMLAVLPAVEVLADASWDVSTAIGAPIAVLSIPRVELSAAVLHGSDESTLRRGPGHVEHTAFPGQAGNVVIAGHRDSFFMPLRHVQIGDDVFLDTPRQRFHYQITSFYVVSPQDVRVLASTGGETLTLITCYPFWVLGNAPDRFIVRASRVDVDQD